MKTPHQAMLCPDPTTSRRSAAPAASQAVQTHVGFEGPGWQIREMFRLETYRITNLRGRNDSTGNRAKQMTKQASAPKLQAPNMSKRSHRLTRKHSYVSLSGKKEQKDAWNYNLAPSLFTWQTKTRVQGYGVH